MKNIWNDPRSLFNENHFSSILYIIGERSEGDTLRSVQSKIADITRKMVPITGRASASFSSMLRL